MGRDETVVLGLKSIAKNKDFLDLFAQFPELTSSNPVLKKETWLFWYSGRF